MTQAKKTATKAAKKTAKVNRSAKSGKFVTGEYAEENPDTTFKDTIKRKRNGKAGCN
ncbi:MAG: hypothetical protein QM768_21685 [Agriterribacter sp.]